jgi:hypothetical protein
MNIGLAESQDEAEFHQRVFDAEELEVVVVGGRELFGSVFEDEGKNCNHRALDVLLEAQIRAFGTDAAFLSGNDLGGILDPVEDAVMDFLNDIVDGDGGAGVVKLAAAAVTGGGRKQGSVGGLDVVAEETEFLHQSNEGIEDLLVTTLSHTGTEIREGGAARYGHIPYSGMSSIGLTEDGIAQDRAEVFDVGDIFEIWGEVENKQRDGIVTGSATME